MKTKQGIKNYIKTIIKRRIQRDQENLDFYNVMLDILSSFDNKKITKRMSNKVARKLPAHKIFYSTDFLTYSIRIWVNGNIENKKCFILGHKYNSTPLFDINDFKESNICYGKAAKERIQKNEKVLDDDRILDDISNAIGKYLIAKEKIKEVKKELNNYDKDAIYYEFLYDVEREFNIDI